MADLLGLLAIENLGSGRILLLIDEPELHLHADAQHSLRRALEALGSLPRLQVIYTTHSPCMINSLRPRSVRLVQRKRTDKGTFSEVQNAPYREGVASVRSSLGISPSDSLLFSPVTVLVEGKTEVLCLPLLLEKIVGTETFTVLELEELLSQAIFLEAVGLSNIPNLVRISRAHGSKVVVFVDGDSTMRWKQQFGSIQPAVPLVECGENLEIENLLPQSVYFDALKQEYPDVSISVEAFQKWNNDLSSNIAGRAFSKRVDLWLMESCGLEGLCKPAVMRRAVDLASADQISVKALVKLVDAIRDQLGGITLTRP